MNQNINEKPQTEKETWVTPEIEEISILGGNTNFSETSLPGVGSNS